MVIHLFWLVQKFLFFRLVRSSHHFFLSVRISTYNPILSVCASGYREQSTPVSPGLVSSVKGNNNKCAMKVSMMLQHTGGHINAFVIRDEIRMDAIKQDWLDRGGQRFDLAILIIAAFNIFAAVLMVCGIMYDSWLNREWDFFFKTRRYNFFSHLEVNCDILKKKQAMLQLHSSCPFGGNISNPLRWHFYPPGRILCLD